MKLIKLITLCVAGSFYFSTAAAQANASINILTLNSGQVELGAVVNVQVTVGNTGPVSSIGVNKVRAQISIPVAIASALPNVQQTGLPPGWTILSNTGGVIQVCNGSDVIPVGQQRQVLIRVQGNAIGGPSTVSGVLSFGPGTGVCTGLGTLSGNNTADDVSQSTIQVVASTLPVTLTDFSAKLVNCKPQLRWTTATERNSDRYEIERTNADNTNWSPVGVTAAAGNTDSKTEYSFSDNSIIGSSEQILYRLKMIDKDGRHTYSGILRVFINCKTTQVFLYPNPVQDGRLYIALTGESQYTEATLQSLSGQVLLKTKITAGTNAVNVSTVASGLYILNIRDESGFFKNIKVLIQQ